MSSPAGGLLVVVQCRFSSSRLPGKALYPLGGLPMAAFLLRRLLAAGFSAPVVLATSEGPEDDPVAAWGEACGADVFRGPKDDVLARYLGCLARHGARGAVRVTADNPLTHPGAVADCLAALAAGGRDCVDALGGYPVGAGADGFSREHLLHVQKTRPENRYHEHLNAFALDFPDRVSVCRCPAPAHLTMPRASLTVDTREEWLAMRALVDRLPAPAWQADLGLVLPLLAPEGKGASHEPA